MGMHVKVSESGVCLYLGPFKIGFKPSRLPSVTPTLEISVRAMERTWELRLNEEDTGRLLAGLKAASEMSVGHEPPPPSGIEPTEESP